MKISEEEFRGFEHVRIIACGTSWHAALTGKFMIESLARIPVEVDYGSEFRYRDPVIPPHTLAIMITQSGETADTLAAQKEVKQKGAKNIAICNVVGSMVTAKPMASCTRMPGLKSEWLRPRALLPSSRDCIFLPFIWPGFEGP
jgi:glucosamine 6-phosphate synthetase-like amidotransferase/phosphosugar isomerase protein